MKPEEYEFKREQCRAHIRLLDRDGSLLGDPGLTGAVVVLGLEHNCLALLGRGSRGGEVSD